MADYYYYLSTSKSTEKMKNVIQCTQRSMLLIFLFVMSNAQLFGQDNRAPVINQQETHTLKSTINGTTYHLYVSLPQYYSATDTTHYPVLFILDGGLGFPIAHSARIAEDMFGSIEDIIIVGIEYEWKESLTPWMTTRWKDFTPTQDLSSDENPAFKKTFGVPEGSLNSGGAATFLSVIQKEIIPFVDKEYRTTTDRGISGHSLGGLFVTYCLFSAPELFNRYGINSPSLWWDKKAIFGTEKSFSEQHQDLSAKVFMSVGSLEGPLMTPVMKEFAEILESRNYKGLKLKTHIFEEETHMSVVPAMISRTIVMLYGTKNQ